MVGGSFPVAAPDGGVYRDTVGGAVEVIPQYIPFCGWWGPGIGIQ